MEKIKILILSANPKNTDRLRLEEEVREIEIELERAKSRDRFQIINKGAVRVDDLSRALLDYEPQIVHFSGHGLGAEGLALENNLGKIQLVSTEALARLFKAFKDNIKCVFLNACYSEAQAEAIYQHIDYVVGMNQAVSDRTAIEFAKGFYRALGSNRSIEQAFELGCTTIDLAGIPESSTPVIKSKIKELPPKAIIESKPNQQEIITQVEKFQYDAYISYVDKEPDATWVWETLLPRLEQANLQIAVSGESANPGVARVVDIEQGIKQAKRTIIILSDNYLANTMADFENVLGQTMGIQEGTYRLLPLQFSPIHVSQLPTRLSMLVILDLSNSHRAERRFNQLIQALQGALPRM